MEETQQKRVAAVIFSADLARCVSNQHRLAPTYIGIRRVRPSSKLVKQALHGKEFGKIKPTTLPNVVFKLVDEETGEERRMTSKEKKKAKSKRRNQQREAFQQQKASEQARPQASDNPIASHEKNEAEKNLERLTNSEDGDGGKEWESEENNNDRYAHLSIDHSALEQELADLRGERDGVPPVALSAPLTFTGIQLGLLGDVRRTPALKIVLDEDLARKWGETLKESMLPAEAQRRAENLREMPYHLVPEVWMRMKPQMLGQPLQINTMPTVSVPVGPRDVAFYEIRPSLRDTYSRDTASDAVVQLLHSNTSLNLSCGAKFGSDFLLYDGNRSARHAFAGMRVVEGDEEFPLPKAYDLSGYVRCLNTAGKLALLAWVQRRGDVHHVAIIDLALEKLVDRGAKRSRQTALERRYNTLAKK